MTYRRAPLLLVFFVFTALSSIPSPVQGETRRVWTLEPRFGANFGYTHYDMSIYGIVDSSMPTVNGARSLLEFPLDAFTAGAKLSLTTQWNETHRWGASAGAYVNVNDPHTLMKDHDWYHYYTAPDFKFSYTESHADLSGYLINVEGNYGVAIGEQTWFDLLVGYRHQRIVEDIFGYSGWQIRGPDLYMVRGDDHALYYRITYQSPYVGMRFVVGDPNRTNFRIEGDFLPTHMSDFDDHVIRHKSSTAAGWGEGGRGEAAVKCFLKREGRKRPFLDLNAHFLYIAGSPKQRQYYYGDDPGTTANETGTVYNNVPHAIRTLQYGLNASIGIEL